MIYDPWKWLKAIEVRNYDHLSTSGIFSPKWGGAAAVAAAALDEEEAVERKDERRESGKCGMSLLR